MLLTVEATQPGADPWIAACIESCMEAIAILELELTAAAGGRSA